MFAKRFFKDPGAVSPVIGVMLMIVVTVILAAAVSSFSGSITQKEAAPQATFKVSASYSDKNITIEHLGGDVIYKDFIKIEISSGRPTMSSYVNKSDITFYSTSNDPSAPLGPGNLAKVSFPVGMYNSLPHADIAGQWIYVGSPFKFSIVDLDTEQAVYSTTVTLEP